MTRGRPLRPASGLGVVWLALACAAAPAGAQRIAYVPTPFDDGLTLHGAPYPEPHIAYPRLPADRRIAPDDFLLDSDGEALASPAEQQRALDQLALSQLSQNYRPRPALWRIGDRDTTIYLFGTIHVLPPGFQWRSAAVDRAAAAADTLIVEAVDDQTPLTLPTARGVPLSARVAPDHRAALARFAAALPSGATTELDAMPTWMAAIAVGYTRDIQAGEIPGPGADDWLEARFRADGKPVMPIEDGAKVRASVDTIPEDEQRRMLNSALDAPPMTRSDLRAPTHAWANGEIGRGSALTLDLDRRSGAEALNGPLLLERNRAWAAALAVRLATPGTALFAAGVAHFIGPRSVIASLRRRGVRVIRVD